MTQHGKCEAFIIRLRLVLAPRTQTYSLQFLTGSTTMFRVGVTARPLLLQNILRSRAAATGRVFSSFRPNLNGHGTILQSASKRPGFWSSGVSAGGSRSYVTDRPIIQEAQGISWQRLGMTAAGVAGAVVVVDAIFNRETRDALSFSEISYLNSSFQYTGAGLALTAIAARSMFKSGYAFRIMATNPCWFIVFLRTYSDLSSHFHQG